jgi:hypothetical protein
VGSKELALAYPVGWKELELAYPVGWKELELAYPVGWMELELVYPVGWMELELVYPVGWMELELVYPVGSKEQGLAFVGAMGMECHRHRFQTKEQALACRSMEWMEQGSNQLELELAYHPMMELELASVEAMGKECHHCHHLGLVLASSVGVMDMECHRYHHLALAQALACLVG